MFLFCILFALQNSRMMSMLLSKSDLAEKTADQNRGLSRRLEQTEQQFIEANARWTKVIFNDK